MICKGLPQYGYALAAAPFFVLYNKCCFFFPVLEITTSVIKLFVFISTYSQF